MKSPQNWLNRRESDPVPNCCLHKPKSCERKERERNLTSINEDTARVPLSTSNKDHLLSVCDGHSDSGESLRLSLLSCRASGLRITYQGVLGPSGRLKSSRMVVIWSNEHSWRLMHFDENTELGHIRYEAWRRGFKTLIAAAYMNLEICVALNRQLCPTNWRQCESTVYSGATCSTVYFMVGNDFSRWFAVAVEAPTVPNKLTPVYYHTSFLVLSRSP